MTTSESLTSCISVHLTDGFPNHYKHQQCASSYTRSVDVWIIMHSNIWPFRIYWLEIITKQAIAIAWLAHYVACAVNSNAINSTGLPRLGAASQLA